MTISDYRAVRRNNSINRFHAITLLAAVGMTCSDDTGTWIIRRAIGYVLGGDMVIDPGISTSAYYASTRCHHCGSDKPFDQSCLCFDNNCQ